MVRHCQVCKKLDNSSPDVSFHKFPADSERRKIWASLLGWQENRLNKYLYVCSDHFDTSDVITKKSGSKYLRPDANPLPCHSAFQFASDGSDSTVFNTPPKRLTRFPAQDEQRALWLSSLKLLPEQITKNSNVCSDHFKEADFRIQPCGRRHLRKNAQPNTVTHGSTEQSGIPIDKDENEAWLKSRKVTTVSKTTPICSMPFKENFRMTLERRACLKKDAVPVYFLDDNSPKPDTPRQPSLRSESIIDRNRLSRSSSTDTCPSDGNDDFEDKIDIEHIDFEKEIDTIAGTKMEPISGKTDDADDEMIVRGELSSPKYSNKDSTLSDQVDIDIKTDGITSLKKEAVQLFTCEENVGHGSDIELEKSSIKQSPSSDANSNFEENIRIVFDLPSLEETCAESSDFQQANPDSNPTKDREKERCANCYGYDSDSSDTLSASENEFFQIKEGTDDSLHVEEASKRRKSWWMRSPKSVLDLCSFHFSTHRKAIKHFRTMRKKIMSQAKKIRSLQQSVRRLKSRVASSRNADRFVRSKNRN